MEGHRQYNFNEDFNLKNGKMENMSDGHLL